MPSIFTQDESGLYPYNTGIKSGLSSELYYDAEDDADPTSLQVSPHNSDHSTSLKEEANQVPEDGEPFYSGFLVHALQLNKN